uniref:Uncharacterized protein n=1 Tax=Oncorhynchus kisutch TaxID=8019 RepID=A0A8C7FUN7_ONCKI
MLEKGCKVEVSDLYAMKFKASATAEDVTGKEVKDEHRKPSDVAVVIFQVSSPAVLLNVLRKFGFGLLIDKKAMLSFTTGSHESMFSANGDHCRYNGNLHYCGFQVLAPQIFWAPTHIPSEACCSMLEAWRTRLEGLLGETPLSFTPRISRRSMQTEFGLTVGTYSQIKAGV